ncbi:MAG: DNA polymerase III subunit delta' [Ignavibacteria bacterium]|nr:DNA polymerase III subunit delta' [Ignavibacteria bacterium]MBI3765310.1 DNA polymerase III subunit delta' [Ignavibacteriales bacterium]
MAWSSVIDQTRVKRILSTSLERGRLAHAYLFSGAEGVGKYAMAIELAKILNCEQSSIEACDHCPSCKRAESLLHPNIRVVFALPVGKSEKYGDAPLAKLTNEEVTIVQEQLGLKAKNPYHTIVIPRANDIKVNSVREIRREASLSSFGRGNKVFIILEAEHMNDEASNAILKTLEEPHDDTYLILTSSRPDNLLPTINSRCQHLRFDHLSEGQIGQALQERERVNAQQATMIARLARGSYAKALRSIDSSLAGQREEAIELLRVILHKSRKVLLEHIDQIMGEYEKQDIEELLLMMQLWLRDAILCKEGVDANVAGDEGDAVRRFVNHYPEAHLSRAIEAIDRAISLLHKNVYIPLIILDLAIQLKARIVSSPVTRTSSIRS